MNEMTDRDRLDVYRIHAVSGQASVVRCYGAARFLRGLDRHVFHVIDQFLETEDQHREMLQQIKKQQLAQPQQQAQPQPPQLPAVPVAAPAPAPVQQQQPTRPRHHRKRVTVV